MNKVRDNPLPHTDCVTFCRVLEVGCLGSLGSLSNLIKCGDATPVFVCAKSLCEQSKHRIKKKREIREKKGEKEEKKRAKSEKFLNSWCV